MSDVFFHNPTLLEFPLFSSRLRVRYGQLSTLVPFLPIVDWAEMTRSINKRLKGSEKITRFEEREHAI